MLWDVIIAPVPANSQLKYGAEANENGAVAPFSSCGKRAWRSMHTSSRSERPGKRRRLNMYLLQPRCGALEYGADAPYSDTGALSVVQTAKGYLTDFAAGECRVDRAPVEPSAPNLDKSTLAGVY